jgi:hypothetical protein
MDSSNKEIIDSISVIIWEWGQYKDGALFNKQVNLMVKNK